MPGMMETCLDRGDLALLLPRHVRPASETSEEGDAHPELTVQIAAAFEEHDKEHTAWPPSSTGKRSSMPRAT